MTKANHAFRSSGSPKFHQHQSYSILFSDGIKCMADTTRCYWLIELIAFYQDKPEIGKLKFQCWELLRATESAFDIIATDSHNHIVIAHQVPFIDFPYDAATVWVVNNCIILPNEFVNCHIKPSTPVQGIDTSSFISNN